MSSEEYLLSLISKKSPQNSAEETFINNQRACPLIKYYKDRLSAKYIGKENVHCDICAVQSNKPANRDATISYFEVKVTDLGTRGDIAVGLADADFPLNKHPGWSKKSYGYHSSGKIFTGKAQGNLFLPKFNFGCVIGCGINYSKREIFFTFNGKYYGPAFRDVELLDYYATISLHSTGEFVTFNFGAKPFRFDLEKHILQEKKTMTKEILGQSIDHYTMHQIVHSYLLFHGYAKTLEAFEKVTQIQRKDAVLMKAEPFNEEDPLKKVQCQEDGIYLNGFFSEKKENEMEIEFSKKDSKLIDLEDGIHNNTLAERYRSNSFQVEFESPAYMARKDSYLSDMDNNFVLNKESSFDPNSIRKNSVNLENSTSFPLGCTLENGSLANMEESKTHINGVMKESNPYLLQERGVIRQFIQEGKIQEVFPLIKLVSPKLLEEVPTLTQMLHAQQFIEYIRSGDTIKAIEYASNNLSNLEGEYVYSLNALGIPIQTSVEKLIGLICYNDPNESELGYFLQNDQRDLVADLVNKEILKRLGLLEHSILDILLGHLSLIEAKNRECNGHYGETFAFRV